MNQLLGTKQKEEKLQLEKFFLDQIKDKYLRHQSNPLMNSSKRKINILNKFIKLMKLYLLQVFISNLFLQVQENMQFFQQLQIVFINLLEILVQDLVQFLNLYFQIILQIQVFFSFFLSFFLIPFPNFQKMLNLMK